MQYDYSIADVPTVGNGQLAKGSWDNLDALWRAAEPYTRVRANDVHLPLSLHYAELLLDQHPEADPLVTRIAILLHDTGWARVDEKKIMTEGFQTADWRVSDIRVQHEIEGCNIARELLPALGYDEALVTKVTDIIDGHDTDPHHNSIEDALVRDADRLWRFAPTGLAFSALWFNKTPNQIRHQLEDEVYPELITEAARRMAQAELSFTIKLLQLDVL
jgi:hypothetical protein